MSILDYFTVMSSNSFPNPRGPLSNRIASAMIEPHSTNREVCAVLSKKLLENASSRQKVRSHKFICHMIELAELGKLAVDTGAKAAKRFSKKLKYPINESTARRFKQCYLTWRKDEQRG